MKHWYLIPLAAVAGIVAGAWGPRADLEALQELKLEKTARREANQKSGFKAIADLARIPDKAKSVRPRPEKPAAPANGEQPKPDAATNVVEKGRHHRGHFPPTQKLLRGDLKARIEDAKELWRTRCELAKTQWKAKLNVSGESEQRFDQMLDDMNADLRDLMGELAQEVAASRQVSPELGMKMVSAVTGTLAEGYAALGECVEPGRRDEVSKLPIHEFIDPSVFEPMIEVQDYLEPSDLEDR